MICFASGSPTIHRDRMAAYDAAHVAGQMSCPFARNHIAPDMPWCLDNGCFNRYEPPAILRMLDKYRGIPGCVFATVPDMVGDHDATRLLFAAWLGTYQRYGYPPAFVLQDGIAGAADVPWDSLAAVFIGGSTRFKYSDTVRVIVAEAKRRGKWVHMGRVNTRKRIEYAASIDCDSTDGSRFPKFKDAYKFSQSFVHRQHGLFEEAA